MDAGGSNNMEEHTNSWIHIRCSKNVQIFLPLLVHLLCTWESILHPFQVGKELQYIEEVSGQNKPGNT